MAFGHPNLRVDAPALRAVARRLPLIAVLCIGVTFAVCDSPWEREEPRPPPNATVRGTITHEGTPVSDAEVTYPIQGVDYGWFYVSRADAHGRFSLDVNTRGRGRLWIRHASGLETDREIEFPLGQRLIDVSIDVGAAGRIGGVALREDGKPLAAVRVRATARDTAVRRYAVADTAGRFVVESVEIGHTYDVELTDEETPRRVTEVVTLNASRPAVEDLRIVFGPQAAIRGVAVDEHGIPVAGATLIVSEPGAIAGFDRPGKKTDATGYFEWAQRREGAHSVVLRARDGRIGVADDVTPADSPVRITLVSPGAIHVVCSGFVESMGGLDVSAGQRRFDAGCGETIGDFPPGKYVLAAKIDRGKYAGATVEVVSGATTEALLEVRPTGTIVGVVLSYPDGNPLAGMECDTQWPSGEYPIGGDPGAVSTDDGRFELQVSGGRLGVICRDHAGRYSEGTAAIELTTNTAVTVSMVKSAIGDVDLGVEFSEEPGGARVKQTTKAAALAGLRPGDVVHAVDGVSLAGLGSDAMHELAFALPHATTSTWTVDRAGISVELRVVAQ